MTTRTNALLNAAITALVAQVAIAKKAGIETLGLGSEILPGVKFRDLKNWLKENGASAHVETKPVAKVAASAKAVSTAKAVGKAIDKVVAKDAAPEFTTSELKGSDLLIGRVKDKIASVVKSPEGVRVAVTENGLRIPVVMLERNNRGNLRTVAEFDPKAPATKTAAKATAKAEVKAPAAKAAHKAEGRELVSRISSNLVSAIYNRDEKTLTVTFKSGAVWQYENVGIREANAMAKEESHGKYFTANIKNVKEGKCLVRGDKAPAKTVAEAPVKAPAAKAAAVKVVAGAKPVDEANELKATEVRGHTVLNGRTKEVVERVVRNKETQRREVVCESGARFPLAMIANVKGKLRVIEVAETVAPVTAKGGAVKKATAAKAEVAPKAESTNRRAAFSVPKISEVRGATFTVNKGSKSKEVTAKKIVTRDEVRKVITENGGELNFDDLSISEGVLHFTGKLMASDFHAL
jgi:IS5 family transposase